MANKRSKPAPVAVETICSVCGLDWDAHGDAPTTDDCIRLLKEALAEEIKRKPVTVPIQVPVPVYPRPWVRPYYWEQWYGEHPYKGNQIYCKSGTTETSYGGRAVNECTPKLLSTTTSAL